MYLTQRKACCARRNPLLVVQLAVAVTNPKRNPLLAVRLAVQVTNPRRNPLLAVRLAVQEINKDGIFCLSVAYNR